MEQTLGLLLNALVAMRLLEKDGDSYGNSTAAATHLVRNSAQYIGHLLLLHDAEWDNWGKLEQTIRTGQRSVDRHVFETDPDLGSNVLAVLHRIGQQSGPDLAKRLQLNGPVRFLDLGGGAGTNAIAFCQAYPELTATVFDLPATLRLTERTVKEAGLESRIALLPGDFNKDGVRRTLRRSPDVRHPALSRFFDERGIGEKGLGPFGAGRPVGHQGSILK